MPGLYLSTHMYWVQVTLFSQRHRFMTMFRKFKWKRCSIWNAWVSSQYTCVPFSRQNCSSIRCRGCTISPPMTAICIVTGGSIGSIKDQYIHPEKGGDQFAGCWTAPGLSSAHSSFAVSLVYWDWSIGNVGPVEEENIIYTLIPEGLCRI